MTKTNTIAWNGADPHALKALPQRRVFIAGPLYSSGRTSTNVHKAIKAGLLVRHLGDLPFIPHLFYFADTVNPLPEDFWKQWDIDELLRCKALLRLPGKSTGADEEEYTAIEQGIPIFYGLESYLKWLRPKVKLDRETCELFDIGYEEPKRPVTIGSTLIDVSGIPEEEVHAFQRKWNEERRAESPKAEARTLREMATSDAPEPWGALFAILKELNGRMGKIEKEVAGGVPAAMDRAGMPRMVKPGVYDGPGSYVRVVDDPSDGVSVLVKLSRRIDTLEAQLIPAFENAGGAILKLATKVDALEDIHRQGADGLGHALQASTESHHEGPYVRVHHETYMDLLARVESVEETQRTGINELRADVLRDMVSRVEKLEHLNVAVDEHLEAALDDIGLGGDRRSAQPKLCREPDCLNTVESDGWWCTEHAQKELDTKAEEGFAKGAERTVPKGLSHGHPGVAYGVETTPMSELAKRSLRMAPGLLVEPPKTAPPEGVLTSMKQSEPEEGAALDPYALGRAMNDAIAKKEGLDVSGAEPEPLSTPLRTVLCKYKGCEEPAQLVGPKGVTDGPWCFEHAPSDGAVQEAIDGLLGVGEDAGQAEGSEPDPRKKQGGASPSPAPTGGDPASFAVRRAIRLLNRAVTEGCTEDELFNMREMFALQWPQIAQWTPETPDAPLEPLPCAEPVMEPEASHYNLGCVLPAGHEGEHHAHLWRQDGRCVCGELKPPREEQEYAGRIVSAQVYAGMEGRKLAPVLWTFYGADDGVTTDSVQVQLRRHYGGKDHPTHATALDAIESLLQLCEWVSINCEAFTEKRSERDVNVRYRLSADLRTSSIREHEGGASDLTDVLRSLRLRVTKEAAEVGTHEG